MISTVNSLVNMVVDTVSGPLYSWGSKSVTKMTKKKLIKVKKCTKSKCSKKCRCS